MKIPLDRVYVYMNGMPQVTGMSLGIRQSSHLCISLAWPTYIISVTSEHIFHTEYDHYYILRHHQPTCIGYVWMSYLAFNFRHIGAILICYTHLRLINLVLPDLCYLFAFLLSCIYRSERQIDRVCLNVLLCVQFISWMQQFFRQIRAILSCYTHLILINLVLPDMCYPFAFLLSCICRSERQIDRVCLNVSPSVQSISCVQLSFRHIRAILICYTHLRLINLVQPDLCYLVTFPQSYIYRSEGQIAGWWWVCLGCMLRLVAETYHHLMHCSAHDWNTCTSLFKCVRSLQSLTHNTICRRLETQDPNPTYLRRLPHRPDEGERSLMFQSRIHNHLRLHHATHLPQKNGPCHLEDWIWMMMMMILAHIKYLSDPERPERWVYTLSELPTN